MSKTDIFSRYSQLYQKTTNREIVPEGVFTRQLADVPTHGMDVGIFFKQKGIRDPRQIYFENELPVSVGKNRLSSRYTYPRFCIVDMIAA